MPPLRSMIDCRPSSSSLQTNAHSFSAGMVLVICSVMTARVAWRPMSPPGSGSRVLFRIGPIEVAVHASWLIIFFALVLVARSEIAPQIVPRDSAWILPLSIGIALLFYAFVLAHELS